MRRRRTLAERLAPPETPEQRHARLVRQAAAMRERRIEKRKEAHVCPPSETDVQLARLTNLLNKVAPANIAVNPIGMMLEDGKWVVDVQVRVRGVCEYDVEGTGETLAHALASAARHLAYQGFNEARSARDKAVFDLAF